MSRLLYAELFKLRRRILVKVLAAIVIVLAVGTQFARWAGTSTEYSSSQSVQITVGPNGEIVERVERVPEPSAQERRAQEEARRQTFLEETVSQNLDVIRWLGLVLGVMLVAGAIGSEYSYGTLRPYLTCAESREKYLGAKFSALGLLIVLGLTVALALGIGTSLLIATVNGGAELEFVDGAYLEDALYDFARVLFVLIPYLLIAGLAAVVGRSAMIGAVVGLILFSVEGGVSSGLREAHSWIRHIPDFLLLVNADAVLGAEGDLVDGRLFEAPDPWVGASVLAAYSAGALALALWVFHRRDVTA